jgi:hypothetical protein
MMEFIVVDMKNVIIDNVISAGYNAIDYKDRIDIIFFGGL